MSELEEQTLERSMDGSGVSYDNDTDDDDSTETEDDPDDDYDTNWARVFKKRVFPCHDGPYPDSP